MEEYEEDAFSGGCCVDIAVTNERARDRIRVSLDIGASDERRIY
jgi:hypothetical protein